jgi:hypothetical protein
MQASKPSLYDHLLDNTEFPKVYHGLKEAISTLSPIIRNRLRGLPAYVLDYSDLIPPNLVEKPFLKPVIVSGPHTGRGAAACQVADCDAAITLTALMADVKLRVPCFPESYAILLDLIR